MLHAMYKLPAETDSSSDSRLSLTLDVCICVFRELLYAMGRSSSRESLAAGYQWVMMPVLNLGVHPRWGR
jgi:beta-glucosidase-like glycosyl hydrolase